MKIFVISLDDSHDRRASAVEQMADFGLEFEFFDACRGSEGIEKFFRGFDREQYLLTTRRLPKPAEIGCYASHLALWRRCIELDEPILILEDDFRLLDNFPAALEAADRLIPDLGFLRMQPVARRPKAVSFRLRRSRPLCHAGEFRVDYLVKVPTWMLCYAISPAVAAAFVAQSDVLTAPQDKVVQRVWEHRQPMFALVPASVDETELCEDSTIGDRSVKEKLGLRMKVQRQLRRLWFVWRRFVFNQRQRPRLRALRRRLSD